MSRTLGPALQVVLVTGALAASPASAADLSSAASRSSVTIVCPDTYCGQRAYADPYIWDGFRHSQGYRGPEFYGRSWYMLRTLRPVYVAVDQHPGYPQVVQAEIPSRYKTVRVHRKRR